jgi:cytochrome c oxidase subunit 2
MGTPEWVVETPNIFDAKSVPAAEIRDYAFLVLGLCGAIFTVVTALLCMTLVRFRRREDHDGSEPPQIYGSNPLELAWTVIPIIIVALLSMVTMRTVLAIQIDEAPEDWLAVTAVGHQWWWEFRYPGAGVVTANELHLPVSTPERPRPSFLRLESRDVIHSFWVPQLGGKLDLIPGRSNHLWMEPREAGVYVGQCAEFCGTQHANMLVRVVVHPEGEFDAWLAAQQGPAVEDAAHREGRDVYLETACVNCHSVRGTFSAGGFGPDLTHLMSRTTLGAGVAPLDRSHLTQWVNNPAHLKPGALMPAMGLVPDRVDALVSYLLSLK